MSDLTTRSADPAEYAQVAELTIAGFDDQYAPDEERLALLNDCAGRADSGDLLVAVDESGTAGAAPGAARLVGTASLLRAGTPYARTARPGETELRLLAVLPAHRGRGIAFALMNAAIERCREAGADALVLDTAPDNVVAQRLYARLGFDRVPERETRVLPGIGRLMVFTHDLGRPVPAADGR